MIDGVHGGTVHVARLGGDHVADLDRGLRAVEDGLTVDVGTVAVEGEGLEVAVAGITGPLLEDVFPTDAEIGVGDAPGAGAVLQLDAVKVGGGLRSDEEGGGLRRRLRLGLRLRRREHPTHQAVGGRVDRDGDARPLLDVDLIGLDGEAVLHGEFLGSCDGGSFAVEEGLGSGQGRGIRRDLHPGSLVRHEPGIRDQADEDDECRREECRRDEGGPPFVAFAVAHGSFLLGAATPRRIRGSPKWPVPSRSSGSGWT
ncbi:hypothetical protein D3C87_1306750 [compost metagenome]